MKSNGLDEIREKYSAIDKKEASKSQYKGKIFR